MWYSAASDLGLHCSLLLNCPFVGFLTKINLHRVSNSQGLFSGKISRDLLIVLQKKTHWNFLNGRKNLIAKCNLVKDFAQISHRKVISCQFWLSDIFSHDVLSQIYHWLHYKCMYQWQPYLITHQFLLVFMSCIIMALKGNTIYVVSISWSKVLNKPFILMQEFSKSA